MDFFYNTLMFFLLCGNILMCHYTTLLAVGCGGLGESEKKCDIENRRIDKIS